MEIFNYAELYEAIERRHSVRGYSGEPIPKRVYDVIETSNALRDISSLAAKVRVAVVREGADTLFGSLVIKGVAGALVLVAKDDEPDTQLAAGYLGEYAVLLAQSLGVSSCWMTGTYKAGSAGKAAKAGKDERVIGVSPLGYAGDEGLLGKVFKTVAKSSQRKPIDELLTPDSLLYGDSPEWVQKALSAARMAPSAVNRQPWLFKAESRGITVVEDPRAKNLPGISKRLDCGIAMAHIDIAARAAGVSGDWSILTSPGDARFAAF